MTASKTARKVGSRSRTFAPGLADADRIVVVMSDIEMGDGGERDDFPHPQFLADLVSAYTTGAYRGKPVDLVFNGDTFDLLKIPVDGSYPTHITREIALEKFDVIRSAHGVFFKGLEHFIEQGEGQNAVHFIVGNHDAEILFPAVQRAIRNVCGGGENVRFPGFDLAIGPVYIEHGSQLDPLFFMDPDHPFISGGDDALLNLSWASIGLLSIVVPLHPLLYFYDRLVPKKLLMELVPELKDLFYGLAWQYWTKDFWRGYLVRKDPLLKFRWTMLKEVIRHLVQTNPNVDFDQEWLENTVAMKPYELFVLGHQHHLLYSRHGTRRIVQTGAMRDEYAIGKGGTEFDPMPKCFLEIHLKDSHVAGVVTREVLGPTGPPEHFPDTIFDFVPMLREQLAALGDQSGDEAARKRQEQEEADAE